MWFLPMLFWCFVISWGLLELKVKPIFMTILVIFLGLFGWMPAPLQLSNSIGYLQYFIIGFFIQNYRDTLKNIIRLRHLFTLWSVFIIVFVVNLFLPSIDYHFSEGINKILYLMLSSFRSMVVGWLGLISIYSTAIHYINTHQLSKSWADSGKYCMGIYIFQQFILQLIYFYTPLSLYVGLWLPWISFVATLLSSALLSAIFLHNRVLRKLI